MVGAPLVEKRKQIIDSSKKILLMTTKNRKKFIYMLFIFPKKRSTKGKDDFKKKSRKKMNRKDKWNFGIVGDLLLFCFGLWYLQFASFSSPQASKHSHHQEILVKSETGFWGYFHVKSF